MNRTIIFSLAIAAFTGLASAQVPVSLYSFETLYDTTNNPNPAGTRPDDFTNNPGGATISQSTIGVTDGTHSMDYTMVSGATFTGALTALVVPGLNSPQTEEISFDLTIPAGGQFAGTFARVGISEFGNDQQGFTGDQLQTIGNAEANIALAPGTYNIAIPLLAFNNPVTFQQYVPFPDCIGSDPGSQITLTGFEIYLNKSADAPITVYIDNVKGEPLLGDTNDDFSVDSTDLATVMANMGQSVTGGYASGDFNGDGVVNADDFALFQLGVTRYDSLVAGITVAPEPTILGGALVFCFLSPLRYRRKAGGLT